MHFSNWVKVAAVMVDYNIPFAAADQLSPLFKEILPDSKMASGHACNIGTSMCDC